MASITAKPVYAIGSKIDLTKGDAAYAVPVDKTGTVVRKISSAQITITDLNDGADAPVPQINPTTNNWELKDLKTGAIKDLGVKAVGVDGKSIKGDPGKDGASSYSYTRYSASSDGSSMTEAPTSASRYVGHYSGPSATCPAYTAFKWAKFYPAIGMKNNHITIEGVETGDSLKGADGTSSYSFVRYSANENGSSMTVKPSATTRYIGHYSGTSSTCPAYTAFTWAKYYPTVTLSAGNKLVIDGTEVGDSLKGKDGQSIKGDKGEPGTNGTSSYSYVRYSPNENGSGMTVKPSSATRYIGHYSGTASSCPAYTSFTWAKYYPSVSLSSGNKLTVDGVEIGNSLKGADGKNGANGSNGAQGFGIVANVSREAFTEAQWTTYGTMEHSETWNDTESIRNGCRIGDLFTVTGKSTDGGRAHTATYRSTTASGNLSGKCISHVAADKGASGLQGRPGTNGTSSYSYVRYSANSDGSSMTEAPAATSRYIGHYSGTASSCPPYTSFKWAKYYPTVAINADNKLTVDGVAQGGSLKGADGTSVTITSTSITYATSTSGTTAPTSGWSTTVPAVTAGNYLWTKRVVTYSGGKTTTDYSVAKHGAKGDKGTSITAEWSGTKLVIKQDGTAINSGVELKGTDGKNGSNGTSVTVSSTSVTYAASASGTTAPTSGWGTSIPNVTAGQYLWTKRVVTYSDGKSTTDYSATRQGVNGTNGVGVTIGSISVTYASSTSATTAPTSGWGTSIPTVAAGSYLWTKRVVSYSDGKTSTDYTVALQGRTGGKGDKGEPGTAGKNGTNGTSAYSYVRYSANANGSSMTASPTSTTRYVGHYSGTSSTCPAYTAFTWAKFFPTIGISSGHKLTVEGAEVGDSLKGADGKNGTNGTNGKDGAKGADGKTWKPTVSSTGQLTWTQDSGTTAPGSVNIKGADGKNGTNGKDGKGIKSTAITYQVGASGTSAPTGTWQTTVQATAVGQFLWTRTVITYTDSTTSTTYSVAAHGAKGTQGNPGANGADGKTWRPTVASDGTLSWAQNSGTSAPGSVNIKGPQGIQGIQGTAGKNGTDGKTWKPTVSSAGQLSWAQDSGTSTPTAVNIKGPQGIQGIQGTAGKNGTDGKTWKPTVTSAGQLSWAQDSGTTAPTAVNIKGPQGIQGIQGTAGKNGTDGKTWKPTVTSAGQLSWAQDSGTTAPASMNIKGAKGDKGATGDTGDTYVPSVDTSGNLSWTKQNKPTTTPTLRNIRGPQGTKGDTGPTGPQGLTGLNWSAGKPMFADPTFAEGMNSCARYNHASNSNVVVERVSDSNFWPTDSHYGLRIKNIGSANPGLGGFYHSVYSKKNGIFVLRIVAQIPSGYTLNYANNSVGSGYSFKWYTSQAGTGTFEEYVLRLKCGSSGTFSTFGYWYISGAAGTSSAPVYWFVSYANIFDMTETDGYGKAIASKVDNTTFQNTKASLQTDINSRVTQTAYNTKVTELNTAINGKVGTSTYNTKITELTNNINAKADTANTPQKKTIGSRGDFEHVVILLWKDAEAATHRINGRFYTTGGGASRYQYATVNMWYSKWSSGYDKSLLMDTGGQATRFELCTFTYGGVKWWGIRHTNTQAVSIYFEGTSERIDFTMVKYYNSNTKAVLNSEINGSIAVVEAESLDSVKSKVSLTTHNTDKTSLQNAINGKVSTTTHNTDKAALQEAINGKVSTTTYNSKVTELNTAINAKVSTSTYNTKVTELQNGINGKMNATTFPGWSTLVSAGYATQAEFEARDDEAYLKGICKWLIATYADKQNSFFGNISPNSSGNVIIHLYSGAGFDSTTKLPRYCFGYYQHLVGHRRYFGTYNYVWKYTTEAWNAVNTKVSTDTFNSTKTTLQNDINSRVKQTVYDGKVTELNTAIGGKCTLAQVEAKGYATVTAVNSGLANKADKGAVELALTQTVDLTAKDANTYYPVIFKISSSYGAKLKVWSPLSTTYGKPAWATHASGFSLLLEWESVGSGWGAMDVTRRITVATQKFVTGTCAGGINQFGNSSNEVVYLRGGGKYECSATNCTAIEAVLASKTISSQTIAPTTTAPTFTSPDLTLIRSDLGTKLATSTFNTEKTTLQTSINSKCTLSQVEAKGYQTKTQVDTGINAAKTELNNSIALKADKSKVVHKYSYRTTDGTTGYIRIAINSYNSWMLTFKIKAYQSYKVSEVMVSGYNYGDKHWYEPKAWLVGGDEAPTVTFGYDSNYHLWVAIPAKSYSGIDITDVTNGYNAVSSWENLFTITKVTTLSGTTQTTVSTSLVATKTQVDGKLDTSKFTFGNIGGSLTVTQIPSLDAAKITSGSFADARIPNLGAGKITSGSFAADRIPSLAASKITSGSFAVDRIPALSASKITSGTFAADRIAALPISKITSLQTTLDDKQPKGNYLTSHQSVTVENGELKVGGTAKGHVWAEIVGQPRTYSQNYANNLETHTSGNKKYFVLNASEMKAGDRMRVTYHLADRPGTLMVLRVKITSVYSVADESQCYVLADTISHEFRYTFCRPVVYFNGIITSTPTVQNTSLPTAPTYVILNSKTNRFLGYSGGKYYASWGHEAQNHQYSMDGQPDGANGYKPREDTTYVNKKDSTLSDHQNGTKGGAGYYYGGSMQSVAVAAVGNTQHMSVNASDMRLKDVIKSEAAPTIADLAGMPAFTFRFKPQHQLEFGDGLNLGSSAQYWKERVPEAVATDNEDRLTLNYGGLALAATKTLAKEVTRLREENSRLLQRLDKLERLVSRLISPQTETEL